MYGTYEKVVPSGRESPTLTSAIVACCLIIAVCSLRESESKCVDRGVRKLEVGCIVKKKVDVGLHDKASFWR